MSLFPPDDTDNLLTTMLGRYAHVLVIVVVIVISLCVTAYRIAKLFAE